MLRKAITAGVAAGILALSLVGAVGAAGAANVTITVTIVNAGDVETFTTAPGGPLCPSGTAQNFFERFGGSGHSRAGSFHGYKVMSCADNSGTFAITYDASTVFGSPTDQGGWHLYAGTGAYAGYSGGGNLLGTYTDTGIIDSYTGQVSTN